MFLARLDLVDEGGRHLVPQLNQTSLIEGGEFLSIREAEREAKKQLKKKEKLLVRV